MARPRSDERRQAILSGAARVIASDGVSTSTAAIAKESGVSNGSLFGYFDTKVTLFNELYITLKTEMANAAAADLPTNQSPREQVRHLWTQWLSWATSHPEKNARSPSSTWPTRSATTVISWCVRPRAVSPS